ncbi:leucyl aminopeptidase family protein [Jatrophihabitans telluris]|uniref:Probable cytosol aminopeptidase n=1 Tax=Jatrophihabitans telluris TaxID=2038343 RepID=A0ABY4QVL9_9ACTN|nr:leucyl aminopeptidase family protein [Jatrophihabitans telluris]UQX87701.1 leucyl aminopeptidase family protein [Jatrophihabitans telluris]
MILLQIPDRRRPSAVVAVGLLGDTVQLHAVSTTALPVAAAEFAAAYVAAETPAGKAGLIHTLPLPGQVPSTVLLVGLGDNSPADLRLAGVAIGRVIATLDEQTGVTVAIDAPGYEQSTALAEGLVLGGYDFTQAGDADAVLHTVDLIGELDRSGLTAGDEAADAAGWARDLGNTPASVLDPARFGELADQQLSAAGCRVTVRDEAWLAAQGFGGVLAVGAGSASGPRLIEVSYKPRRTAGSAATPPHVVLVGKGITFDTGGLNLKPAGAMRMMHTDMCGGAAVLAAIQYAAIQRLPVRVTALVPAAENAVSGSSMRPSDIITHYGGRTTEIGNTDAEGRLVLADALAYAVARLKPDVVVDVATLTGAMKVALGLETAGYFANDDHLAAQLERASATSGEHIWRMPLEHRYAASIDSPVADARNDPGNPGGITAALFLQPFVGEVAWAHLDIAGPARATSEGPIFAKGATGFGARLLARYLELAAAG